MPTFLALYGIAWLLVRLQLFYSVSEYLARIALWATTIQMLSGRSWSELSVAVAPN